MNLTKNIRIDGIRRVFLLGDLHLGIRNNSLEWSEIQRKFLTEIFPRHIEPYFNPETDILLLEGDIFHSRDSINVRVYNEADNIFRFLTDKFKRGVYAIVGNHDVYYKSSNVVNSISILQKVYSNFHVFTSPHILEINDKHRFLMLPWIDNIDSLKQTVTSYVDLADYVVCHADINGFSLNKHQQVEHGIEPASLSDFKRVYAGHIHLKQEKWNVLYTGTPYSMDRGDRDSQKGFYVLDVTGDDVNETYIENLESPKFIKVNILDILDMKIDDIRLMFKNNFVDIMIETRIAAKMDVSKFNEISEEFGARKIEFFTYSDDPMERVKREDLAQKELGIFDAFDIYLEGSNMERTHRSKVVSKFNEVYKTMKDLSHV